MTRRIIAFWLGLTMMLGLIVMVDVTVDFTFTVGGETLYVNKTGSGGAFTSIQHAINYSQDGGTVFVYSGTYYERVLVNKTINLTGENRETTIINVSGSGDVVLITAPYVNMTGFTITNDGSSGSDAGLQINSDQNKIYGNNIFLNNRYGIHLYFSDNNNITNNNVSYNGIAIYLYESSWNNIIGHDIFSEVGSSIVVYSNSNNNIIAHNTLSSINRSGITIYTSKWNNLTENTIHKGGIFVFGGLVQHWNTHYIDTSNSVNGKPVLYWKDRTGGTVPLGAGQVILANCVNVAVENQNISNCPAPVELGFSSNCNITKNNATNGQYGILLCRSNDNTIIGNNASSNLYGIYLDYSQRNNILFNEPYDNGYGVILDFSKENNITNNILYDNAYAILLDRSDWNNITDNNASHNLWGALIGMNSNGNTVEDNIAYNNAHGIHIVNAHWNHIIYNNILSNFAAGINIDDDACWNEITNNNITNNDNGIRIMHIYAENNKLFHNSFIGNNRHAIDMTIDKNEWDNGYPSGGNYWSDYTGVDYFKGPNQDQPGSDGIGDTNYSIDSDSVDHYPLIEPYTYKPFDNYTILKQGWNLISIPHVQINQNLTKVLEMIDGYYDAVQWYDIIDPNDPWKHHKVGKPFGNDLFKLNETMGFWIHITQPGDTIFIYNGTQPTVNKTITLHPGWSMLGYPSITSYNRTKALNNLSFNTHVDAILTFNASTHKWKELGPSDYFELGKGYWIHAKTKCEWKVPL